MELKDPFKTGVKESLSQLGNTCKAGVKNELLIMGFPVRIVKQQRKRCHKPHEER